MRDHSLFWIMHFRQIGRTVVENQEMQSKIACHTNLRVLLGAVELYNMDVPSPGETNPKPGAPKVAMLKLDIPLFVKHDILKSAPQCKKGGAYALEGDIDHLRTTCSIHGFPQ